MRCLIKVLGNTLAAIQNPRPHHAQAHASHFQARLVDTQHRKSVRGGGRRPAHPASAVEPPPARSCSGPAGARAPPRSPSAPAPRRRPPCRAGRAATPGRDEAWVGPRGLTACGGGDAGHEGGQWAAKSPHGPPDAWAPQLCVFLF